METGPCRKRIRKRRLHLPWILQAREVVKHRDLLSSAAPVAATQDPARITKSQEKTKIAEIPVPAKIKAERKEPAKPTAEPTPQDRGRAEDRHGKGR